MPSKRMFIVAMSPRSASHRPRQAQRCLINTGVNIKPMPSIQCPPWIHCLSRDFTWLTKPTLEKHTSQLSLVMPQYVHGQYNMSVDIRCGNKMEQVKCNTSVGFPKSSHIIYLYTNIREYNSYTYLYCIFDSHHPHIRSLRTYIVKYQKA